MWRRENDTKHSQRESRCAPVSRPGAGATAIRNGTHGDPAVAVGVRYPTHVRALVSA